MRYICRSMTYLHKIWHADAERISEVYGEQPPSSKSKNRNIWGWSKTGLFSVSAVRHLEFLKLKFLTAVHFRDTFCMCQILLRSVTLLQGHRKISQGRVFLVKYKISSDDRAKYGITLSQ